MSITPRPGPPRRSGPTSATFFLHPLRLSGLLTIVFIALAGRASAAEWGARGEIHAIGAGITPGIASDERGGLHLVYMRGAEIFHRSGDAQGRWDAETRVPAPDGTGDYNSPHLVCDPAGTLHLVFTRGFTRHARVAWYTNRQAGAWRDPVVAIDQSDTGRRVNYPRLAVAGTTVYIAAFAAEGSRVVRLLDVLSEPRVGGHIDTRLWVAHPLLRGDELLLVGRAGGQGHMLEPFSRQLAPTGEPLLLSRGTPKKTGEPTAAVIDRTGVIHAVGVTGGAPDRLWYANDRGARQGREAVLGPELGDYVDEYTYPVLQADARGRIYVAYRDHSTGEGRITVIDPATGQFAQPVTFAPALTRRLRWNAPLAAAAGGGVYVVWEADGRVYLRGIGVPDGK
jgi:hypothetical protein